MKLRTRHAVQLAALILTIAGTMALAAWIARNHALRSLSAHQAEQLHLRALSLQRLVDRYRVLPSTLALDRDLRAALEAPAGQIDTHALNRKLERTNGATHVSTLTLINSHGVAIAASNWRDPSSNVGRNYTFRPYYRRAMKTGEGTFYAIGVSTHVPGYFIGRAIRNDAGRRIGVIVVKITLKSVLKAWSDSQDIIALSDHHGVVFLSNRTAWQYRPLHALDPAVLAQIARNEQYANHLQPPARWQVTSQLPDGGELMRIDSPGHARTLLERMRELPTQGWTLNSLSSIHAATLALWYAALITLGAWLPLILLGLFIRQRMRLAQEAERASRNKTRYVAAAVHDLLQPLNAARLYTGSLRKKWQHTSQHTTLEHIDQALAALDGQLGSMLELSRLDAGAIKPQSDDLELAPMLASLASEFGIIARAQGLTLTLVNTRCWVRSDALLLRRILQNYLSNALHYTRHGRVLLGCRRRGSHLRIEVWDTGIGIAQDQQKTIFREFARLDTGHDTDERSAGLGLAIVKRLAKLLGHSLTLRSRPGRGSVFAVEVPRVAEPRDASPDTVSEPQDADADSPLAGCHVLCVDDDRDTLAALQQLLASWFCEVRTDSHPEAARQRHDWPVDLIILDYRLGAQTALDLLPDLYAGATHRPPVIILSALVDDTIRQRIREAGLYFLAKPAAPARLRALMSQLLIKTGVKSDRHSHPRPRP